LRARRTIAGAFAFVSGAASELVIPSATRRIRSPGAGGARFDDCFRLPRVLEIDRSGCLRD
jgi:hypothetical protein